VITIDGVEYNPEDLSDEVKYMVAQVKDIDDKLGHLRFQVDQLSVARDSFGAALIKEVEVEDVSEGAEE
jgi:CHAD domain-containing protein